MLLQYGPICRFILSSCTALHLKSTAQGEMFARAGEKYFVQWLEETIRTAWNMCEQEASKSVKECVCVCACQNFNLSSRCTHTSSLAHTTLDVVRRTPYVAYCMVSSSAVHYNAITTMCFACFMYTVHLVVVRSAHGTRVRGWGATNSHKPNFYTNSLASARQGNVFYPKFAQYRCIAGQFALAVVR